MVKIGTPWDICGVLFLMSGKLMLFFYYSVSEASYIGERETMSSFEQ